MIEREQTRRHCSMCIDLEMSTHGATTSMSVPSHGSVGSVTLSGSWVPEDPTLPRDGTDVIATEAN